MKKQTETRVRLNDFMYEVSIWIDKPMNRCILDYHYSIGAASGFYALKNTVKAFLQQRFFSMYGKEADESFLKRAVKAYLMEVL